MKAPIIAHLDISQTMTSAYGRSLVSGLGDEKPPTRLAAPVEPASARHLRLFQTHIAAHARPSRRRANGIAVSPVDGTLAVADYAANRMLYYSFLKGPNAACTQCGNDPSHTAFFFCHHRKLQSRQRWA
jgi:hypothetical protein